MKKSIAISGKSGIIKTIQKEVKGRTITMTINELADRLEKWTDHYGWSDESLNNFANVYATSYEEYNAIWAMLNELKIEA